MRFRTARSTDLVAAFKGDSRHRPFLTILGMILAFTVVINGCSLVTPTLPESPVRTISYAYDPRPKSRLAEITREVLATQSPGQSGFLLLDRNVDALKWRLLLADLAEETLDLQYYVWKADISGDFLLERIIRAADRGVRVRLLVDDFPLMGADRAVAALSQHPGIEVRLFNPVKGRNRSAMLRGMEFLANIEQLNHRMHNKLMMADNRFAIVGGRNIGNEYFGLNAKQNFLDLDVLALGPVTNQLSHSFDLYWNSEWAFPGEAMIQHHPDPDLLAELRFVLQDALVDHQSLLVAFQGSAFDAEAMITAMKEALTFGSAGVIYDEPLVGRDMPPVQLIESLGELTDNAQTEVLVATPYFVPDEQLYQTAADLNSRGVRLVVLTNSLGSTNHPIVHSGYKKHRVRVLDAGVTLVEARRDALPSDRHNTPPVMADAFGLHAKFIVIDRRTVFVGSLNLDPRSIYINMEMGLLIDSPELAEDVTILFEELVRPETSWRVTRNERQQMIWQAGADTRVREPPSPMRNRFQSWFLGLFALDDQL